MTFKDAESAKKACEDATPIINGRRANCNLASLGARRSRPSPSITPPPPPPQQGTSYGKFYYMHSIFMRQVYYKNILSQITNSLKFTRLTRFPYKFPICHMT